MSEDQSFAAEPKKGGSKIWLILFLVLGLPVLLCGGCCAGSFFIFRSVIKNSEPYKTALERVISDQAVVERLGEPIEDDAMPFNSELNDTDALFTYGISGPNGTATVNTESVKEGGYWRLTKLTVTWGDDGKTINLLPNGELEGGLEIDLNLGDSSESDNDEGGTVEAEKAPSDSGSSEDDKK